MPRILVVEDDIDLQFLYDKALMRLGYEIVKARNVGEAIVYLTNEDFDAIILDINLPDAPGIKVLEFARGDVRLRNIPVLIASANEKYRQQAHTLGVQFFMVKPVPLQDLISGLKEMLGE
jgi:two-component system chemotaxis response regulator CheY